MEFVSIVVDKALVPLLQPVGRQLGYVYNYGSNVEELKERKGRLEGKRTSRIHEVEEARGQAQGIENPVPSWLNKAESQLTDVEKFLGEECVLKTSCLYCVPNLKLRHWLGRKAKKMSSLCDQLLGEEAGLGVTSYPLKPEAIEAALYDGYYVSVKSREAVVDKVMDALRDPTAKMIGICGQGGVGKTALVKKVAKKARDEKLFSVVVIANIASIPDVRKIQGEMADMLGLTLGNNESRIGRAGRLRQRFREEKALVILDDLWSGLNLNMLGIPSSVDDVSQMTVKDTVNDGQGMLETEKSPGDSKGCKILVTSRFQEVISSEMDITGSSIIPLDVMEEEEAVELFNKVAGVTEKDDKLKKLSAQIANRCARLPMAIITVAKALRNTKSEVAWKSALEQMERHEVVEALKPVEFSTKLIYDHMQSEELKSFFLLCARICDNPSIADLVKYCIGLGIFQGVHTVKEARDRTAILVNKLKDSSLLLNAGSSDQVTMQDLVRDAALSIAFKEQDIFTMRYGKLDEWPDKEKFERYSTISLHHCDVNDEILESLNCPRLKVFHVESNNPALVLPDTIFEGMGELRVLVLIGIDLSSLPSSIKCLKKLRMLCLEKCVLGGNISIIGELKNLRGLSLSGSKFENLPTELGQLGKLQFFDISNCTELLVMPPNVISNLISLEELYMENDLIQWGVEEQTSQKEIACLYELWHLQQLKRLNVHVQDVATLPRSLSYDKLDTYKIVIGNFERDLSEDFTMCCASRALALQLKKSNDIYFHQGIIKMLFKSVDHLFLGELDGVQNVINELNLQGFPCLKHLTITRNTNIQYIINSMKSVERMMAFPKLESMYLYELQGMEKICNSFLTNTSFCNLRTIKINSCSQLQNLFPFFMVEHLTNLQTMEVSDCGSLRSIVFVERPKDKINFPQLKTLTLQSLPELTSFYTNENMPPISRKDEISVADEQSSTCDPILFNRNVSVQNLTHLNVKDCRNLKYLFSLSMVGRLGNLQSLSVKGCAMMNDIFKPEDDTTKKERKGIEVFPQLEKMEVTCMEELETIWYDQASLQSFHSLDHVIVKECNKLVTIFPNYMVRRFGSLARLEVINCKLVEKIFDLKGSEHIDGRSETSLWNLHIERLPKLEHIWSIDQEGILDFKNLKNVQVVDCSKIKNVFPISVARGSSKLEDIRLSMCPEMKEIVSNQGMPNENDVKFEFHRLTTIALQQLPQLTSFYEKTFSMELKELKQLYLISCDKLDTTDHRIETTDSNHRMLPAVEKVISKLEAMAISPKEMKWLQDCLGNDVCQLHNINTLYLDRLRSIETLFWFIQRTPNLENLFLGRCSNKEMLSDGSLVAHEKIGTVVHLKSLRLWCFHAGQNLGFLNHPIIQRVEQLYVVNCSGLITLFPSTISFTHLTYLEVSRCSRLKNLMTVSTAKSLVQLIGMKITQCEMMEEIVIKEEGAERVDEIVFSQLKSLELWYLRDLKSFCSYKKGLAFKFPSLENLILRDCFKMEYFCKNISCIPKLKEVNVGEEEGKKGYWEGDLNSTIKKIFVDMVFFQYIEELQLFEHPGLERVCQGEVPMPNNCFGNLKSLVVSKCFFISSAFLSKLLSYLKNLENLKIDHVPVEVIFDIDELRKMNADSFGLKALTLDGLPFLKCVWSKDPHGFVSFPNLQEVVVSHCDKLKTLLPASLAKNLVKLEISICYALVEIVGRDEAVAFKLNCALRLPSLTSLLLYDLPELQCFYHGISNLECPKLAGLRVVECTKLDIFISEDPSHQGAQVGTSSHKQALFLIGKVIGRLETLWLNKKMTSMLCLIQHLADRLDKLKELKLFFGDDDNEATTTLPFEFLQKLPNLTSLSIDHLNSLKEMSPSQKIKDIDSNSMLESALPFLSSLGLENSLLDSLCQNLEDLRVKSCPCLTILVFSSSTVSFCNLKHLIITECHGLVYLLPCSVAKSLVQLETMTIQKCKSIRQVVSPETGESASDEVIFEKLANIELISLSSLVTFCSGKVALQFPILQVASICDCPMMKIFSQGLIWAPNFLAIRASSDHYDPHYFNNINSTVEKLFWDRVSNLQDLTLGDHPELEDIWRSDLHIPEMTFTRLKSLVVEDCKICSIIPFHLLPYLGNLESLEVRKCASVKTIFDVKVVDSRPTPHFSLRLKKLILEKLPNLEHIWNEDPQGVLSHQCLQQVCVDGCKSIKSLFPTSVAIDELEKLEVKSCEELEEIIAKDKTEASSNKVFIFDKLSSLTLWELPELKYFYPGQHQLEWPELNLLDVYHCRKLRTFKTSHSTDEQATIVSVEKVLPKLKEVLLSENDIIMFSHEKSEEDLFEEHLFECTRYLKLTCFHGDQTTKFPYRFFLKARKIEKLLVGCSSFSEIFPSIPQLEGSEFLILKAFGFLSKLKELELNNLRELESIGLEYSWHSITHVLESLRVVGCSSLIHILPSTGSFSSLVYLTITECHKLEYLFTSLTARTLTFLNDMSISRCDSMKEIVAEAVDDSDRDVIVLHQLKNLSLYSLPKLESFYSGSSTFHFPCLKNVSINECVIMKIFCQRGHLKTPQLPCDLNAEIQKAHDTNTPFYARPQIPREQSSLVDEDEEPGVHKGTLLDPILLSTSQFLSKRMDRIFPLQKYDDIEQMMRNAQILSNEMNHRFPLQEYDDTNTPFYARPQIPREQSSLVDEDEEPGVHKGTLLDPILLSTRQFLSKLMDRIFPHQKYDDIKQMMRNARVLSNKMNHRFPPQEYDDTNSSLVDKDAGFHQIQGTSLGSFLDSHRPTFTRLPEYGDTAQHVPEGWDLFAQHTSGSQSSLVDKDSGFHQIQGTSLGPFLDSHRPTFTRLPEYGDIAQHVPEGWDLFAQHTSWS